MIKEKTAKNNDDLWNARYVVFYCDECELLDPIIVIHRRLHPDIEVMTFSDADRLIEQVQAHPPLLILAYLHSADRDYISFVKHIRQNVDSTIIPVVIYKTLPTEKEIAGLINASTR